MMFRNLLGVLACVLAVSACGDDVPINGENANTPVIEAHLEPDQSCELNSKSQVVPRGAFDLARGGVDGSTDCDDGYDLNLLVNNRLGEVVVFNEAEVTLQTDRKEAIVFNRDKKHELPNPLTVITSAPVSGKALGVVTIQAIPKTYAHQLDMFKDSSIHAHVVLHGQAVSGAKVTSRAFTFPIDLCDGCMTMCYQRDVVSGDLSLDDVLGTSCRDNAGADERMCLDTGC